MTSDQDPASAEASASAPASLDAGGLLRAVRRELGLSQRGLAALLGVSQSVVARVESGRSRTTATPKAGAGADAAPGAGTGLQLLAAAAGRAGYALVLLRTDGSRVEPFDSEGGARDLRDRRYPAHRNVDAHLVDGPRHSIARYRAPRYLRDLEADIPDARLSLPRRAEYLQLASDPRTLPGARPRWHQRPPPQSPDAAA